MTSTSSCIANFNQTAAIHALRSVLPNSCDHIALHEPSFGGNEAAYLKECITSGMVSSVGYFVDRFEQQLVDYTDMQYAVAAVNGTSALHICNILAGVEREDEVLVPTLTFVATANAVSYAGAIPHFIDSEESTLGICAQKLKSYLGEIAEVRSGTCFNKRTGRRIKALVAMHAFGHPVDLDALWEVCSQYQIELIEDAAESLGSYYKGKHTGHWGKVAALSFNGNKIVTTGGGGAILTNDQGLAKLAKHLTTTAKLPHKWAFNHDQVGFNYRLPSINAAIGSAQLEQLPDFVARKRSLAERYRRAFAHVEGMKFFTEPAFARSNYWLNVILLDRCCAGARDAFLEETNRQGIMTRPAWTLMHQLPMYQSCPKMGDLSNASDIEQRLINIPSSANLCGVHG